ncbi:MAG: DUF1080 domain-containing protein [Acidobacteria bacterium]|nr:DUF1080 domain-containing protein [Acidobacteriota bacterium]
MRIKTFLSLTFTLICFVISQAQEKPGKVSPGQLAKSGNNGGWKRLFDGKTLNGWRGFHSDKPPEGWAIEDGCIKKVPATGQLGRSGGDLITTDQFSNFELELEWKISKGGNSGIKYLISESLPPTGRSGISFEYQVLDDESHPDAKAGISGNRLSGAVYDLIPPATERKLKPAGEFNLVRILVKGNQIEHWLNGIKVVAFDRSSQDFKERIAKSKFKDTKGFGEATQGHILLQDHGNAVWFRNIRIRELK